MERLLNRLNLVLVVLVGGLCLWQWSGEKRADAQIENLRRGVAAGERRAAAQDQAIRGANEDIDEFKRIIGQFKARSDASDVEIRQAKARVFALEQQETQRAAQAAISARELAAYKQGIADRDASIRLLLDERQQLISADQDAAHKANQAVVAYNDLATKYTALVGRYNELARRYQAEHPPATDGVPHPSS